MHEGSFILEVLKSKDETLAIDIKETIPQLTSKIERLKSDVKAFILGEDRVAHHVNVPNNYKKQVKDVNGEMKNLDEKINSACQSEVDKTLLNIQYLEHEIKKSRYSLELANYFVDFHETYKELCNLIRDKEYVKAVEKLTEAFNIITKIPRDENLDILESITTDLVLKHSILISKLRDIWDSRVKIEQKSEKNMEIIKIGIDNSTDELSKVIQALYQDNSTSQFDCFADFLLEKILTPILKNTVKIQLIAENDSATNETLDMRIKIDSPRMHYDPIFDNISTVFDYLCSKIDYDLDKDLMLVGYIGNRIREKFCDIMIKNYLNEIIPSTEDEFENYKNVVKRIEALNFLLRNTGFFDEQSCKLFENAGNVELAYANKICQNYLAKATAIYKKDLHDMVEVGSETDETKKSNVFSKCFASRSACELLNLIRLVLDHAVRSTASCADKLLHTAKQIIENYSSLVPTFHKKLLETIPQQAALFFNNCMYLSNELLTYEEFYGPKFSKDGFAVENFDVQIKYLHTAGTVVLMKTIKSQTKQIEDILNESDLASLSHVEKLDQKCNKSVRQCLRQLEVLKTVWQKVLSYETYNKSIGDLLNSFIDHCIKLVILAEDISAANSNYLVEVFQLVQSRGPTLFTEPNEIHMYTKSWNKFKELILLLNSSLSGIDDRWADGKGPLAHEFAAEDVRKLIKALFQNTDHRATVLSKIYKI